MSKYHINSKGVPSVCKAKKGRCPFGGSESHYESAEKAMEAATMKNENEFGLLPETKKKKRTFEERVIQNIESQIANSTFDEKETRISFSFSQDEEDNLYHIVTKIENKETGESKEYISGSHSEPSEISMMINHMNNKYREQ